MTALVRRSLPDASPGSGDRAMTSLGLQGVRRGEAARTTIPGKDGRRAGDLLDRDFSAEAPNLTWVMDFTYVRTWSGFVYVAFILDVFAQKILAWNASTSKVVDLVDVPLRIALWQRDRDGHAVVPGELIGHADAGSQGGFNWSSQHLDDGGVQGWRQVTGLGRPVRCLRGCVVSGVRTGRCGHRCVRRAGRIHRGRCSDSSGG
jgi:hypothetical protein